ncbi:hypothetical protein GSI_15028 [Ganoderma sinense ZZ0214-1]|uniref:G-patch domain-containing protein n=1 Tax=Ganoderma sinense ZZ0214-1 TaxID=1077348 RepID=A0A2G8RLF0_9APHY|nr:hypothetical protein GSI_15028 [Ganoderma sinense ZZ0214-1]
MATVAHYIRSHYDAPGSKDDEDVAEDRTEEDARDPWLTESAFGASRRLKNPPRFIPAIVSYDEVNDMMGNDFPFLPPAQESGPSHLVGDWYRSLPRASSAPVVPSQASPPPPSITPSPSPQPTDVDASTQDLAVPSISKKNDWFSSGTIMSAPSSSRPTPAPTPTLADILSREPPPEHKDQPFVPPVFLHIGPSNRGFAMLQQSGWSEGEALGATTPRRTLTEKAREKRPARTFLDDRELSIRTEEWEVAVGTDDDIREVRKVDVVDLTLSDSEGDEDEFEDADDVEMDISADARAPQSSWTVPSHNPTALLTPIATVLKSDRLGIGLKAKTEGPYKTSKKRVTHNQAALAAHTKANEEMRMRKALFGRGTKSFARIAKAEAQSRQKLLATLKE